MRWKPKKKKSHKIRHLAESHILAHEVSTLIYIYIYIYLYRLIIMIMKIMVIPCCSQESERYHHLPPINVKAVKNHI